MTSPFPKIQRTSLSLCNKNFSVSKTIAINANISKNLNLKNKIIAYDNINEQIINQIIKNAKDK